MRIWKRCALAGWMTLLIGAAAAGQTVMSYHEINPGQALSMHKVGPNGPTVYIQGFSSAVADAAFAPETNPYARYQSYGAIRMGIGPAPEGWDYARWPGTTAIRHSAESLAQDKREPINGQRFVGGSYLGDGSGVFAMQFHDTTFDTSFWFNKTVFCFGNKVICLGSDIENHDYTRKTETTLYQVMLPSPDTTTYANAMQPIRAVPDAKTFGDDKPVWLVDPNGTGYVAATGAGLHAVRQRQFAPAGAKDQNGRGGPASNDFAVAYIDHGTNPYNGQYEYTMIVNAGLKAIAQYAEHPEHTVIEQDKYAHILRYNPLNLTAYVLFRREEYFQSGPLVAAGNPCIVMVQDEGDTMRVSVCEPAPEEAVTETESEGAEPGGITLKLRGKWVLAGPQESVHRTGLRPGTTTLVFQCANGLPTETLLRKKP